MRFKTWSRGLTALFALIGVIFTEARALEIVVDNDAGAPHYTETGTWTTSGTPGYNGGTYRFTYGVTGAPTASATWTPDLPFARPYEVWAVYRQSTNRTTAAPLTITHSEGTTPVSLNQNGANLMVETYLGTFTFDAGTGGSVRLDNNGTTAVLIADAMIWRVPVDPPPVISAMTRQPEIVTAAEPVTITAAITDNGIITSASLQYSVSPAAVSGAVAAFDDGAHGDGAAGDGIFGAAIPAQPVGSTVGYHIAAADDLGQTAAAVTQYYYVGPLPPFRPDVVVDNDDGPPGYAEMGTWTTGTATGYDGGTYRYASASPGVATRSATWTPAIPHSGVYRVYAAFVKGSNRTARAPVTITHAAGEAAVDLNQFDSSTYLDQVFLGEYPFDAGTSGSVRLDNNGAAGVYIADAMIWHMPSDLPPVIAQVTRHPATPGASDPVLVTAAVTDNLPVASAALIYTVNGGAPFNVPAFDDGAHGDGAAGDGVFGATIPALADGSLVRLHYTAQDSQGQTADSREQRYTVGQTPRTVYVVLSSDTSVWGFTGGYYSVIPWNVFESRMGVLSQVYDPDFRYAVADSLGRPFKLTWFMHGGAWFRSSVNSVPISATYHIRKNWGADIEAWGDALEYHFHHYVWDDGWKMAPTFAETIWEYEWVMSEMMLEENLFVTSFRSGWNYMDNSYQQYLERWVPFRMEGVRAGWVPYHPSYDDYKVPGDMKGWEVRHHYTKSVTLSLANQIFNAANQGADQVVCIWSHQNEGDFPQQLAAVDNNLHLANANYPGVQFVYCSAKEAMQRWLNTTDTEAPPLEVHPVIVGDMVEVTINTADDIYQEQPWVAARRYAGDCVRLDAAKIAAGTWEFQYSTSEIDRVAVGVSDIFGNEAMAQVDDGSRRWAGQSDFYRAHPVLVDFDTSPSCARLASVENEYVTSGTLTFEHELAAGGTWTSYMLAGFAPPGTSLRSRYRLADAPSETAGSAWSDYQTGLEVVLPPGSGQTWLSVEVALEGTPDATPGLWSLEMFYEPLAPPSGVDMWTIY